MAGFVTVTVTGAEVRHVPALDEHTSFFIDEQPTLLCYSNCVGLSHCGSCSRSASILSEQGASYLA